MVAASMDEAKVIVSTYEELPRRRRRRSVSHGGPAAPEVRTPPTSTPRQASGGYNRRALLLAYARQMRQRRAMELQKKGLPLLEWKTDPAGVSSSGDDMAVRWGNVFSLFSFLR